MVSTSHHVWDLMRALEALAFIREDEGMYVTKILTM